MLTHWTTQVKDVLDKLPKLKKWEISVGQLTSKEIN